MWIPSKWWFNIAFNTLRELGYSVIIKVIVKIGSVKEKFSEIQIC